MLPKRNFKTKVIKLFTVYKNMCESPRDQWVSMKIPGKMRLIHFNI